MEMMQTITVEALCGEGIDLCRDHGLVGPRDSSTGVGIQGLVGKMPHSHAVDEMRCVYTQTSQAMTTACMVDRGRGPRGQQDLLCRDHGRGSSARGPRGQLKRCHDRSGYCPLSPLCRDHGLVDLGDTSTRWGPKESVAIPVDGMCCDHSL